MKTFSDETIIESWGENVTPWTAAILSGEIESRVNVTNQAIEDILKF